MCPESWGAHVADPLDSEGRVKPRFRRAVALALADYATHGGRGREPGDLAFEEVTEGRQLANEKRRAQGSTEVPYSSCGDLVHWALKCLGCTDETLVNRSDDGGEIPWRVGANISRIVGAKGYVKARGDVEPQPGDALFLRNSYGGHVCILREWDPSHHRVVTDDYGQPGARRVTRTLTRNSAGGWTLNGNPLDGWLNLDAVPFEGPAQLPDPVAEAL